MLVTLRKSGCPVILFFAKMSLVPGQDYLRSKPWRSWLASTLTDPMRTLLRTLTVLALLPFIQGRAYGVFVTLENAVTLDQLTRESDVVFEGTAVSNGTVWFESLESVPGFATTDTRFQVVTFIKGSLEKPTVTFRHYDKSRFFSSRDSDQPHYFHFEPGKTYLVFAKREPGATASSDVLVQPWLTGTTVMAGKPDQGILLCADDLPVQESDIHKIFLTKLEGLLKSSDPATVLYGLCQLNQMSDQVTSPQVRYETTPDFSSAEAVPLAHSLMTHPDARIAQAAIALVGSHNPYLSEEKLAIWMENVGLGKLSGHAGAENPGGKKYAQELVAIANRPGDESIRGLAVAALGKVADPALEASVEKWLLDSSPAVRRSAVLLLADFPNLATAERLRELIADPDPAIRIRVAYAIALGHYIERVDLLDQLNADPEARVRQAADISRRSLPAISGGI